MAKNIELFYFPASFYSQKARMYLSEKGVSPKLHVVSLPKGENLSDSFMRMNPEGKIPVLRTGGTVIPDSNEIFKFGEDNIPGKSLVPSHIAQEVWNLHDEIHSLDVRTITFGCLLNSKYSKDIIFPKRAVEGKKRVLSEDALKRLETRMVSAPRDLVPLLESKMEDLRNLLERTKNEVAVERAMTQADTVLAKCEAQLEGQRGPFLFGDIFTIADIDLAVLLNRLTLLGLNKRYFSKDGPRRNLLRFIQEVEKRDSYQMIYKESLQFGHGPLGVLLPLGIGAVVVAGVAVCVVFLIKRYRSG